MPLDALAALPTDYLETLDDELQAHLAERLRWLDPELVLEPMPLPASWIQGAAAQNITIETTDDLTPELVGGIADFAPQMLADLTPEMLLVMPLDALSALPEEFLQSLDDDVQCQLVDRLAAVEDEDEPEPVPLPESWIQGAAAQNITIETTADLTPEIVGGIAAIAPQMLEDLTPEMLLAMPGGCLSCPARELPRDTRA